jgi:2'-5' RNA ligase
VVRELDFPYHPHVTVAHGIPTEAMDRAQRELADFTAAWSVTGFSLYERDDAGAWHTLREFAFGRPPGAAPAVPQQHGEWHGADAGRTG